jgi:hypothetical protein
VNWTGAVYAVTEFEVFTPHQQEVFLLRTVYVFPFTVGQRETLSFMVALDRLSAHHQCSGE